MRDLRVRDLRVRDLRVRDIRVRDIRVRDLTVRDLRVRVIESADLPILLLQYHKIPPSLHTCTHMHTPHTHTPHTHTTHTPHTHHTNTTHSSAGDLVLMDAGCEYYGYVSDVTRTWPVSGKFTPAQRDLYEAVLSVKQESIQVRLCVLPQ